MNFATVCSGIGSPELAWGRLGWRSLWHSEVAPFPSAVLEQRFGGINLGDMERAHEREEFDREPVDVFCGGTPCQSFSIAGLRKGMADPRGNLALVYLAMVDRLRPRWVVWENVTGVLSSNKGRDFGSFIGGLAELGYGFAYRVLNAQYFGVPQRRRRVFVIGHLGDWRRPAAVLFEPESLRGDSPEGASAGPEVTGPITARFGSGGDLGQAAELGQSLVTAPSLRAKTNCSHRADMEAFVTHSLRGSGFDASEDGTGRGTPLVFDRAQITSPQNRSNPQPGGPSPTLHSEAPVVARSLNAHGTRQDGESETFVVERTVRRLTPRECERLQGFPDDHTAILYRGKPAADGPRYESIGNSMAVPVMEWIGRRIGLVESHPPEVETR